jgi:hypothetical protein
VYRVKEGWLMMINCAKTEEIRVSNITDKPITIENRDIKQVTDFYHLGSTVSEKEEPH